MYCKMSLDSVSEMIVGHINRTVTPRAESGWLLPLLSGIAVSFYYDAEKGVNLIQFQVCQQGLESVQPYQNLCVINRRIRQVSSVKHPLEQDTLHILCQV